MPNYLVKMPFGSHKVGDIVSMRGPKGKGHVAIGLVEEIKEEAPKKAEAKKDAKA